MSKVLLKLLKENNNVIKDLDFEIEENIKSYWIYLKDGYSTCDGSNIIHEYNLKDLLKEFRYVTKD